MRLLLLATGGVVHAPIVPVRTLPYFRSGVRRVYLSATLTAEDAFVRTFGKAPDHVVAPATPAGQCERMVLVPGLLPDVPDPLAAAKSIVAPMKALVLVPTYREGEEWDDVVTDGLGETAAEQVEAFKRASTPDKLKLVARYDGVDLPGDTCRMMVIHGLPSALGPLERYFWETLRVCNVLRSTVVSRLVQSFGRISRGMSDYERLSSAARSLSSGSSRRRTAVHFRRFSGGRSRWGLR